MKQKRILSLILSLAMIFGATQFFTFAADSQPAEDAEVFVTVSVKGVIAADNEGLPMANRSVIVTDIDKDGKLSYDEAVVAAHKAYNAESGYDAPGGYMAKLWNIGTYNTLFFADNKGIESGVAADTVKAGDRLTFSVNADDEFYADWYSFFQTAQMKVEPNQKFTLNLNGHLGMAFSDEDKADVALSDVSVGLWTDGKFAAIDGKTTDENGKVTLSFEKEGVYTVTASGTVKDTVTDWSTGFAEEKDCPIIAPACVVTVENKQEQPTAQSDEEAVATLYEEFSKYGVKSPLIFPLEYNEKEYTNIIEYIKAWAKEETGREATVDFEAKPNISTYTDWSEGKKISKSYVCLDEDGNVTRDYFLNNANSTLNYLKDVSFTVGEKTSETIKQLRISVPSLQRSPQDIVAYVKASLPFERIANGNVDCEHIIKPLGEISGTSAVLPTTYGLYNTTSVKTNWMLEHISGKSDALSLKNNKITVLRPNVGEDGAVFELTAEITSKTDESASESVKYRLTVPPFEGVTVKIRVTQGATLLLTDNYFGGVVDEKYIVKLDSDKEDFDLYEYTLHTSATGEKQVFNYTAEKEGYITQSGKIEVTGESAEVKEIELIASSENDLKLTTLKSSAPQFEIELDPDVTEYSVDVDGAQYVTLGGTLAVDGATAKITSYYGSLKDANAEKLKTSGVNFSSSGTKCWLPDKARKCEIQITVTAPKGSVQEEKTRVYTLKVNKKTDTELLTGLVLKAYSSAKGTKNNISADERIPAEETLLPTFVSGANESPYGYTVNYWQDYVTVKPTASNCLITVNGNEVNSGTPSEKIPLEVGNNEIKISVEKGEKKTEYVLNVRRKAEFYIDGITVDNGKMTTALAKDGSNWTGTGVFDYGAEKIGVTFATNMLSEENVFADVLTGGKTYSAKAGSRIEIPVEGLSKITLTVYIYYTAEDGVTEGQKYIIGLYRKSSDAPSAVESYLPAPGQYVNLSAYREANKTLGGTSAVTLGAFGGNIVYKYDEPIKNDPNNPYGIDFIVFGNCFTNSDGSTSSGAAEPAAVAVSKDGENWYELAGSEYYGANARHNVKITYENGDTEFLAAADTPWITDDGESGVMPKNSYHSQPYYPNPEYYADFQNGIGKNESYTAESVSFAGTVIEMGFYPFGYADSHSEKDGKITNIAANPYSGNHSYIYNGDGFDLAWAVDSDGNSVELDEISYIKIYNATLSYGTATGEKSAEITQVLRAAANQEAVGKSDGLASFEINGKTFETKDGVYAYTVDAENASSLKIKPTAKNENANIYVSDRYVKSEEEISVSATSKLRIIVQEGIGEPAIYILTLNNIADKKSNAELVSLTLVPGDSCETPNDDGQLNFTVANGVSSISFIPKTANKKSKITLSGGLIEKELELQDSVRSETLKLVVGENNFTVRVISENGAVEKEYTVTVTRKSGGSSSGGSQDSNTIRVKFMLTGDVLHYDSETGTYIGAHSNPGWISMRTVSVPKNSTVKYLTEMILNNENIEYVTSGVYISEIKGLAEFDNGDNSGWMYRCNGYIGDYGYADKKLSDGDVIRWFYTDDYKKETGYVKNWDKTNSSSGTVESTTYTVRFETYGGSFIKSQNISKNGTVEKPNAPEKDGYAFGGWYADKEFKNEYDFSKKVTGGFTLYAKWIENENSSDNESNGVLSGFSDVLSGSWYEKAVEYAVKNKLFEGVSKTEFAPKAIMTRAMLVTVIYRLENPESKGGKSRFTDLTDEWYYDAVVWASENGIVCGVSDVLFAPNEKITREQTATVLYRYAKFKGINTAAGGSLIGKFDDCENISEYALEAVEWAVDSGLVKGMGNNTLAPQNGATRAEIAEMLMRFCENVLGR